jgi:hypothetical protein
MSVDEKLEEFLEQGATSAYSGGYKVMELIGEGKSHLIPSYLDQIRNYGDNEKVRGIVDVVYEINRPDLLEDVPVLYTKTNGLLDTSITFEEVDRVELFIQLSEGTYQVEVQMEVKDLKDYSDHFDVDVYHNTGNILQYGCGCGYDEKMIFKVSDLEEGICRLDIYTKGNKGTIIEVKVSPWVYKR